jgi:hypothetical protein
MTGPRTRVEAAGPPYPLETALEFHSSSATPSPMSPGEVSTSSTGRDLGAYRDVEAMVPEPTTRVPS